MQFSKDINSLKQKFNECSHLVYTILNEIFASNPLTCIYFPYSTFNRNDALATKIKRK